MIFPWSAMESHSNLKVLEIFNMNENERNSSISFFKPATNRSIIYNF